MKSQNLLAIAVLGAVLAISGLFVVLPSGNQTTGAAISQSATSVQLVSTFQPNPPPRQIEDFGSVVNLSDLALGTKVPSSVPSSYTLIQVRTKPDIVALIYNSTSFLPYYDKNISLIVLALKDGSNYTYPFNSSPYFEQINCNNNATLGPLGCTTVTTYAMEIQKPTVTNFTLADGAKGYASSNTAEWWDGDWHYMIFSAGLSVSQEIGIADSMK